MPKNDRPLGRGLGAMLGDMEIPVHSEHTQVVSGNTNIRIESIEANPYQPRTRFDEESLGELAQSIKTYGLIQPVTVRPIGNGKYQLISGERRFRAAQLAGLTEIPAFVRTVDDALSIQMALVENIQRSDLNAIEIALAYQHMSDTIAISPRRNWAKKSVRRMPPFPTIFVFSNSPRQCRSPSATTRLPWDMPAPWCQWRTRRRRRNWYSRLLKTNFRFARLNPW